VVDNIMRPRADERTPEPDKAAGGRPPAPKAPAVEEVPRSEGGESI
jgi:hypothetical protein